MIRKQDVHLIFVNGNNLKETTSIQFKESFEHQIKKHKYGHVFNVDWYKMESLNVICVDGNDQVVVALYQLSKLKY